MSPVLLHHPEWMGRVRREEKKERKKGDRERKGVWIDERDPETWLKTK